MTLATLLAIGCAKAEAFDSIMAEVRGTIKTPSMFMTEGTVEEVSGKCATALCTRTLSKQQVSSKHPDKQSNVLLCHRRLQQHTVLS